MLADLVASGVVPRVHLTAIYRQAARSLIIQSARRINAGELPFLSFEEAREALGADAELDEDFYFVSRNGPESIRDAVLETRVRADPRALRPRRAHRRDDARADAPRRRSGLEALNAELERRLNPGAAARRRRTRTGCASARGSSRRRTTTRPIAR